MLKQCLTLIFAGFVTVSERMLEDHLIGGKYSEPNEKLRNYGSSNNQCQPRKRFLNFRKANEIKAKSPGHYI